MQKVRSPVPTTCGSEWYADWTQSSSTTPFWPERKRMAILGVLDLPSHGYYQNFFDGRGTPGVNPASSCPLQEYYDTAAGRAPYPLDRICRGLATLAPGLSEKLEYDALGDALRQLETELRLEVTEKKVDIPLFLKDLPSLVTGLNRHVKDFGSRSSKLLNLVPPRRRRVLQRGPASSYKDAARRVGKDVADLWLEYSYAIKTTMADVDVLARRAAGIGDSRKRVYQFTASKTCHVSFSTNRSTSNTYRSATLMSNGRLRGKSVFRVDNPFTRSLQEFGFTDPLGIAWECIPFSFVIDWFVPVGNWIQSWQPIVGMSHLRTTLAYSLEGTLFRVYNLNTITGKPATGTWKLGAKGRSNLTQPPQARVDLWDPRYGINQFFSSLALTAQRIL